ALTDRKLAVSTMKRRGLLVLSLVMITILLTWLAVNNGQQKTEINGEGEEKLKEEIVKVHKFDPNQSQTKGSKNDLVFSLVEAKDSTNANKKVTYTVKNEGTRNQKLSFTTSQRYDYELSSKEKG
ncbi:hypothetical protein J4G37_53685, partial [Microvirga sp. 3-52]|nr:hypothetical protein [Microvirga sp. 3-52]